MRPKKFTAGNTEDAEGMRKEHGTAEDAEDAEEMWKEHGTAEGAEDAENIHKGKRTAGGAESAEKICKGKWTAGGAEVLKGRAVTEKERLNHTTGRIIECAIAVHRALGPGLLESAYEACLLFELVDRGLAVRQQVPLPVVYRGVKIECGYRLDLFVEEKVVVEVKAVEALAPIHQARLLSYLKLTGSKVGLLINFNVRVLKEGIRRVVKGF